jgi:adenylate cyclase
VIAYHSSSAFKGKAVRVQDIARELGVAYVVEGSVRRAADRVRINAQLVDAATGSHLWAERYDRDVLDIFAVQDEVARSVASTVSGRVEVADRDRIERLSPTALRAYDLGCAPGN